MLICDKEVRLLTIYYDPNDIDSCIDQFSDYISDSFVLCDKNQLKEMGISSFERDIGYNITYFYADLDTTESIDHKFNDINERYARCAVMHFYILNFENYCLSGGNTAVFKAAKAAKCVTQFQDLEITINTDVPNDFDRCDNDEQKYLDLMEEILEQPLCENRTSVKTKRLFGRSLSYDLSGGRIPLMTTKHVSLRLIVEEMLWMLRGQTNSKILEEKHVNIWKGNSTKEYLSKQGLDYDEGELGPIYGFQWRNFNGKYPMNKDKLSEASTGLEGGIDQLKEVIKQLINDPFSRRIIMSAWNPCQLSQMALPPCHLMVIFSVSKQANKPNNKLLLSTHVIMRSNDMFLGHPYNAAFYAILTHLIAKLVDMQPNQIQFSITDAHLYENQLSAVRSQLELVPYRFPKFNLDLSRYSLKDIGNLDAEYTELDKIINSLDAKDFTVDKKYKGLVITVPMIA